MQGLYSRLYIGEIIAGRYRIEHKQGELVVPMVPKKALVTDDVLIGDFQLAVRAGALCLVQGTQAPTEAGKAGFGSLVLYGCPLVQQVVVPTQKSC